MSSPDLQTAGDALRAATHSLLGDTIQLDDDAWRAPSALAGWTRAHVASHLARNADAMSRVVDGVLRGERPYMYDSREARDADIEAGSTRGGLEIQEDLDRSAERFERALEGLSPQQWTEPLALRPNLVLPRADLVLLQRLTEVAVHHIDLDIGVGFDDLDAEVAGWLLDRSLVRLADGLNVRTVDDRGIERRAGTDDAPTVTGSVQRLLGWLLGRLDNDAVDGGEHVDRPAY